MTRAAARRGADLLAAILGVILAGAALAACGSGERSFEAPVTLNGREVAPDVLNAGEFVYMQRCRGCHGPEGRGDGRYASSMDPAPADLTRGAYRRLPESPSDAQIGALLRDGIEGTAMGPQGVPEAQMDAIVQYVRWLAAQRVQ